jgi:hypothetical protein
MEQSITVTATCEECERPFLYDVKVGKETVVRNGAVVGFKRDGVFIPIKPRQTCPGCGRLRLLASKKRSRQRHYKKAKNEMKLAGRPSTKGNVTSVIRHSHEEIAKALRMKKHEVERLERQVLLKIRNDPELKKLWSSFKEVLADGNGGNWMQGLVAEEDHGMRLLKYQMAVVEFWEVHDLLVEEMQETGRSFSAEAAEILEEIRRLQQQIMKALRE